MCEAIGWQCRVLFIMLFLAAVSPALSVIPRYGMSAFSSSIAILCLALALHDILQLPPSWSKFLRYGGPAVLILTAVIMGILAIGSFPGGALDNYK